MERIIAQQQEHIGILKREMDVLKNPDNANHSNINESPNQISLLGDSSFNFGAFNEVSPNPILLNSKSTEIASLEVKSLETVSIEAKKKHKEVKLELTRTFKLFDRPNYRLKPLQVTKSTETDTKAPPKYTVSSKLFVLERSVPIVEKREQECATEPIPKEIVEIFTEVVREVVVREKETKEIVSFGTMTERGGQGVVKISPISTQQKHYSKVAAIAIQTEEHPKKETGSQTETPPKPTLTLNTNKQQVSFNPSPKPSPILSAGKIFNFNLPNGLGNSQTSLSSGGSPPKDQTALVTKLEGTLWMTNRPNKDLRRTLCEDPNGK